MAKATLDKVLRELKDLTREEQQQVHTVLDRMLTSVPATPDEDEFEQQLLREGLLWEIPPPIIDFAPYLNYTPVEVKGKPISETLIEERR